MGGARIIDIDALLPDDIELVIGGETYTIPGDVPAPDVLRLMQAARHVQDVAEQGDAEQVIQASVHLHDLVVGMIRRRHPGVDIQLGQRGLRAVVVGILEAFGMIEADDDGAGGEAVPPPAPRRGSSTTRNSKPATGGKPRRARSGS